ncbi:MAG: hypothetical protein L3K13_07905 [Thermoplasmata archaeon]|nr:hypothetical protein [Thermoplasmata archaeon]
MRTTALLVLSLVVLSSGCVTMGHAPRAADAPVQSSSAAAALHPQSSVVGLIELDVKNPGSSPTGVYDQHVLLDSARFAGLLNSNLTNFLATYATNGTSINGWIESGASNASVNTSLWLRLGSIPAEGTAYIALDCYPKSSFELTESGTMGENPLISSTYGKFDNGWRVFNLYDNFTGHSLSNLWSLRGGWTTTVNDRFQVGVVPGTGANITSRQSFPFPAAVDFYGDLFQTFPETAFIVEGIGSDVCTSCHSGDGVGWDSAGYSTGPTPYSAQFGSQSFGNSVFSSQQYALFTTEEDLATTATFQVNYTTVTSWANYTPASPLPVGLALSGYPSGGLSNIQTTYWIRERSFPAVQPNLSVYAAPSIAALVNPPTLSVGQSLEILTTVADGSAPYRYAYWGLPPGCTSLNAAALSCVVSAAGQYLVDVNATDAAGIYSNVEVNVTVTPVPVVPLTVSLVAAPADVTTGSSLALLATVNGGAGPYAFVYYDLPSGCISVDRASFSCSPTATGVFTAIVQVNDSTHDSAEASANVTVRAAQGSNPSPLTISFVVTPAEVTSGSHIAVLTTVTGGVGPYAFAYFGLPSGCAPVDRASFSCSPTGNGVFSAEVYVSDSTGASVNARANLTVLAPAGSTTPSPSNSLPAWELGALFGGVVLAVGLGAVAVLLALRRPRT